MKSEAGVCGLYVIADTGIIATDLTHAVAEAIDGGARVVQYRDKSGNQAKRQREAGALRALCRTHAVLFLVNDDVELAQQLNADGVHLGEDDAAIDSARRQLGTSAIIGVSCYNSIERGRSAVVAGASYVAFGSFYASSVKPDAVKASVDLLSRAQRELTVPIVAIGGITPENGARLVTAGADALAVITGVFASDNICDAARRYTELFNR